MYIVLLQYVILVGGCYGEEAVLLPGRGITVGPGMTSFNDPSSRNYYCSRHEACPRVYDNFLVLTSRKLEAYLMVR